MPLVPLKIPPGVVRPGTVYDARGRWFDTNLVRWFDGTMQPFGGWQKLTVTDDSDVDVGGPARGVLGWRSNDESRHLVLGTPDALYEFTQGVLTDITPTALTAGAADAALSSGAYGDGVYGAGVYGAGDTSQVSLTEAQTWQLDNFGEDVVAVAYSDDTIYYWDKSAGGLAAALANAPTAKGVVVTPERFVVALAADGDGRRVAWSDQSDATNWTEDPTTQAGGFNLPGDGQILAGRRSRTETLIWTDTGLFAMRYVGGAFVYTFQEIASAAGAISRRAMAVIGERAIWMGQRSFFLYDGYEQVIPSEVGDYVFGDMNRVQASKIWCETRAAFSEIIWYYCSAASTEIDRYVVYNFELEVFYIGKLERVGGIDQGAFDTPLACDAAGKVYQHELGTSYLDPDGNTLTPEAESGPFEAGDGFNLFSARQIIPDEKTLGELDLYLISALYPTSGETTHGPYTPSNPTDVRVTARQMRFKVVQGAPGWRLGTPRLEGTLSGPR